MGTYSFWDYYETFGGTPEPGDTYPDDQDALRDAWREEHDQDDEAIQADETEEHG